MWNPLKDMDKYDYSNVTTSHAVPKKISKLDHLMLNAMANLSGNSTTNSNVIANQSFGSALDSLGDVIPGDINLLQGLGNALTGNADFQRQLGLQIYNNSFNAEQAQKTRDFNAEENAKQRDWYTEMANTSYQRQVADLQASGLNPYVSLSGGAPVAYGTSANSTSPTATAVGSQHSGQGIQALASVANSALSAYTQNNVATANNFTKIITSLLSLKK